MELFLRASFITRVALTRDSLAVQKFARPGALKPCKPISRSPAARDGKQPTSMSRSVFSPAAPALSRCRGGRLGIHSSVRRDRCFRLPRGPKTLAIKNSRHISIRGITVRNSPNYSISMLGCEYVDIHGVTVLNSQADGIDPLQTPARAGFARNKGEMG